jgi:small conductance mechanosensitive channel
MNWESITDWVSEVWDVHGGDILLTLVVVIGGLVVSRILKGAIGRWERKVADSMGTSGDLADRERAQRLTTLADVARIIVSVVVWVVVILTCMGVLGIPMTPFIAVGTTVGVAVGFGAQDVVRDIIAGFLIVMEDQYSIGDVVTIAGVSGSVEAIQLRTTVLRDLDGNRHHVPNGQIKVASNLTSEFSRLVVDVHVAYATDIDQAIGVIFDEGMQLAHHEDWRDRFLAEPEMLGVNKLDDSSVAIRILMTLTTEARWAVKREFLRRIKNRLDTEGIEIPFPHIKVITQDSDG